MTEKSVTKQKAEQLSNVNTVANISMSDAWGVGEVVVESREKSVNIRCKRMTKLLPVLLEPF